MMITLNEAAKEHLHIFVNQIAVPNKKYHKDNANEIAWLNIAPLTLKEGDTVPITIVLQVIDGKLRIT